MRSPTARSTRKSLSSSPTRRMPADSIARARQESRPCSRSSQLRVAWRATTPRLRGSSSARGVSLVCLAGFMRLIGTPLLEAFPNAILNVHPSLLPAFPGVDAQRQALEHGVKVSGATVHLVTGELDGGPIVLQSAVPVRDDDTVDLLSARILDRRAPHLSGSRTHRPRRPVARGRQTVSPVHRRDDERLITTRRESDDAGRGVCTRHTHPDSSAGRHPRRSRGGESAQTSRDRCRPRAMSRARGRSTASPK